VKTLSRRPVGSPSLGLVGGWWSVDGG